MCDVKDHITEGTRELQTDADKKKQELRWTDIASCDLLGKVMFRTTLPLGLPSSLSQ